MSGLIGKKIGMTSVFDENGKNIACTVIEAGPCVVTQIKTQGTDGYDAVQLAFDDKKEKNCTQALVGHFKKAGTGPKRKTAELQTIEVAQVKVGDVLTASQFNNGDKISVVGTSKGKGFQGVVKRHGFGGVGGQTHGQHNRLRAPGSMGASSYPSRVFKGKRLPGRMGFERVTLQNISILRVLPESNIVLVKGAVPGAKGSYLILEK